MPATISLLELTFRNGTQGTSQCSKMKNKQLIPAMGKDIKTKRSSQIILYSKLAILTSEV